MSEKSAPADKARLASILSKITTGNPEAPWKIVIYGPRGIGKSTFASHCPGIAMIPFEEGVNQLRVKQFPQVQSWPELHDTLDALLYGDHDYKAVGLDGVDTGDKLLVSHIDEELRTGKRIASLRSGKPAKCFEDLNEEYGAGYAAVTEEWGLILEKLDRMRRERGMRVFFIGHAKATRVQNLEGKDYDQWQIQAMGKGTVNLICNWSDYVLFARRKATTIEMNKGKKIIGAAGDYVIQCKGTPSYDAKTRGDISFPEELPLNWTIFEETATLIAQYGRTLPEKLHKEYQEVIDKVADPDKRALIEKTFKDASERSNYAIMAWCGKRARELVALVAPTQPVTVTKH